MTLDFPEAIIRYLDTRHNEDASANYMRIYFSACLTEVIREAMDWGEPAHGVPSGKFDGELAAITMMMVPKDPGLKAHAFSMDISTLSDFTFKVENDDNGNRRRTQVNFIIRTQGLDQFIKFGQYYFPVGSGESKLTVSYHKQETLDADAGKRVDMAPINGRSSGLFQIGPVPTPEELAAQEAANSGASGQATAGCEKCDELDHVEDGKHTDGSDCVLAMRSAAANEPEPLPLTTAQRKKLRKEEEDRKKALRGANGSAGESDQPPVDDNRGNTLRDTAPTV